MLGLAPHVDLSPAARASALRAAERIVAEKNAESRKDREAFAAAGWREAYAPPPDAKLTAFDPSLLDGREQDLRVQIASTVAAPAQAGRLAEIVRRAHDAETRTVAVEALGRISGHEAQAALFGLLQDSGLPAEDPARRAIAPLLHPKDLDAPYAAQLAAQLDSPALAPAERQQIAFSLALVGLRDGTRLPDRVVAALSPASRELLARMTALATASNATR